MFSSRFYYLCTVAQIKLNTISLMVKVKNLTLWQKNKNNALKTSFIFRATGLHLLRLLNSMQPGRDESLLYLPKQNSKLRTVHLFVWKILK